MLSVLVLEVSNRRQASLNEDRAEDNAGRATFAAKAPSRPARIMEAAWQGDLLQRPYSEGPFENAAAPEIHIPPQHRGGWMRGKH